MNKVTEAVAHLKAGRRQEAESLLAAHLRSHPDDGTALAQMGELVRHQPARLAEAIALLERATRHLSKHFMPWLSLGSALRQARRNDEAAAAFAKALSIDRNLVEAANDLGVIHLEEKRYAEAKPLFEKVLRQRPDVADVHMNLARTLASLGEIDDAESAARRALALNPYDADGIRLFLAGLGREAAPAGLSDDFMKGLYARRATSWDAGQSSYHGHELVAAAFDTIVSRPVDILDAGCGTGLVGALVKGKASRLDGVDLSREMLEVALAKKHYTSLACEDLRAVLEARPGTYDVILSAATLIHFGDLGPIFQAAYKALKSKAAFVFTVFPGLKGQEFSAAPGALGLGGCFAHSEAYIRRSAGDSGFSVRSITREIHEYQGDDPVHALVVTLIKRPA